MREIAVGSGLRKETFSDTQAVCFVANLLEVSEYQVFQLAHQEWYGESLSENTMNNRFRNYLDEDIVPLWVWDYVQRVVEQYNRNEMNPKDWGVEPKPEVSHDLVKGWLIITAFIGVTIFSLFLLFMDPPHVEVNFMFLGIDL